MEEDVELKRIRQKKLKELMEKASSRAEKVFRKEGGPPSGKPVEVTDATLMETIQNYPLVVIDCWASWCAPCHIVAPIIEEMAQDYADKILFGKLDVEKNQRISMQYQIMSVPTLLVFKDGQLVDRIVGAMPRQKLEPKITCYLRHD